MNLSRENNKEQFTVIAKFMGVEPCERCNEPYCKYNLPHYEQWDNLKPVLEKIADLIKEKYPKAVFSISDFGASTSIDYALGMAIGFIDYHNNNLTPTQRIGDKEG